VHGSSPRTRRLRHRRTNPWLAGGRRAGHGAPKPARQARREADIETWARGILAAARLFPGHLGALVLDAPGSRERHILFSFADRKRLQGWLDSAERRHWLARVEELLEADRGLQQLTGLETWLKLPGSKVPTLKPPPRWRVWLVSLVAVYPLVLAFQVFAVPG
jgi:antibiotic biosynthesis monooxygenase (ABM) superfamily enzyme